MTPALGDGAIGDLELSEVVSSPLLVVSSVKEVGGLESSRAQAMDAWNLGSV